MHAYIQFINYLHYHVDEANDDDDQAGTDDVT